MKAEKKLPSIGTIAWDGFFGVVKMVKATATEQGYDCRKLKKPIMHEGKLCPFIVFRTSKNVNTGEITPENVAFPVPDIETANRVTQMLWQEDQSQTRALIKKAANDRRRELLPPPGCASVTEIDEADQNKARQKVIEKAYPNLTEAWKTKDPTKIYEAYILDTALRRGKAAEQPPNDPDLQIRLGRILEKHRKLSKSDLQGLAIDTELARGWICERYCYMSPKELAKAINKMLGTQISEAAIQKRFRRLGFSGKRREGRPEKQ